MTLDQARERIEALEAEVAWLKSELTARYDDTGLIGLHKQWKLSTQQAAIVLELRAAFPKPVRDWVMAERLPHIFGRSELKNSNFIKVQVFKIRRKMGLDVIDTVQNHGYALAAHWVAKIDEVIA